MTDREIILAYVEANNEINTAEAHRILPEPSKPLAQQILMRMYHDAQLVPCGASRFRLPEDREEWKQLRKDDRQARIKNRRMLP